MFCPKCGEILPERAKTCRVCGASLGASQKTKPAVQRPAAARPSYQRPAGTDHSTHQHHYGPSGGQKCYTTFQQKTTFAQGEGPLDAKEALRRFFRRFGDFRGRSGRGEFVWPLVLVFFGSVVVLSVFTSLAVVWLLGVGVPFCALTARRCHDIGMDGRWGLLLLAPIVGMLMLALLCVKPSGPENKWGPVPRN